MDYTEVLQEQKRVEAETDAFLADERTIRFETTDYNFTCLSDFLDQHGLEVNVANLVFAFESLVRDGLLELIPFATPVPPQPEPTPNAVVPAVVPAPTMLSKRPFLIFRNGQPLKNEGARRL